MHRHIAPDPAVSAALQVGVLSYGVAQALSGGLMNGIRHADRVREADMRRREARDLAEALSRADELGRLAIAGARRIAALEAEVRQLKTVLAQRQAFIDRNRARSAA
ncbi:MULTISPECIES: hypothetical protein [unclassified Rhizobium]|uniref:hypothetical protein n=1 Tax=unclassified Rhizobium TaxID=2613769 RepID=UPI001618C1F7|nr:MULTISPECIES: hypothetical protein [unclassified Rhizobium]MBB3521021.1 hypothetical protein [Rhizobium sp. BK456]MDR6664051.1 hypothetical protein [Rhizobium sp. 1399]